MFPISSEHYWRTDGITETRNDNGTEYTRAEYCSRFSQWLQLNRWSLDLNDTGCKLEKQYSSLVSHGNSAISSDFQHTEYNGMRNRNNVLIHCVTSQN